MTDRLIQQRGWIALLYGLAVVLAEGVHAPHGPAATVCAAGVEKACAADHEGAGTSAWDRSGHDPREVACPSCDFILSHHSSILDRPVEAESVRACLHVCPAPPEPRLAPGRPRSRAPPFV